jgi:hypothetical protein
MIPAMCADGSSLLYIVLLLPRVLFSYFRWLVSSVTGGVLSWQFNLKGVVSNFGLLFVATRNLASRHGARMPWSPKLNPREEL